MKTHGSDGIPRHGHEAEYAEELWLDGPSAFWLHPEGPDSDTTPEEWLAKKETHVNTWTRGICLQNYANIGMQRSGVSMLAQMQMMQNQAALINPYGWQNTHQQPHSLGNLLGNIIGGNIIRS